MQWALAKAKELNLPNVAAQVKTASEMVERIKKEQVIVGKLKQTTASGGYTKEGDTIDFKALEPVVAEAVKFQLKTAEGKKLGRYHSLCFSLSLLVAAVM
jgi:hypothetical protein